MKRIVVLLFTLSMAPSVASADPFTAYFNGTGYGKTVSGSVGGSAFSVWAGQIKWDAAGVDDFLSYCIDLKTALVNQQEFTQSVPAGISASDANAISYLATTFFSSIASNAMGAGLQLAIWNILYDNDYSVSTGNFTSGTAGASSWANTFLADLALQNSPTGNARFLNTNRGQDQVTVPEPGTLLLLGSGLAALAARRRLRKA